MNHYNLCGSGENPLGQIAAFDTSLKEVLADAAPVFDKSTEDGTAYRIYRFGTVEVRTMQDSGIPKTVAGCTVRESIHVGACRNLQAQRTSWPCSPCALLAGQPREVARRR